MLPAQADILLVTDSSSDEDLEVDDHSYYPPGMYAQTWQGYITHIMHICIAMLSFYIIYTILNAISLVDTSYIHGGGRRGLAGRRGAGRRGRSGAGP